MQLWVDLDGVLADFDEHYFRTFGVKLNRNGQEPDDLWTNIRGYAGEWYADLPLMPGAELFWQALLPYRPKLLSGVPTSLPESAAQKRAWVDRHFGAGVELVTCKSRDKCLHGKPGDVLVDDWHKYRDKWTEMGGVFVLHTNNVTSLAVVQWLFGSGNQVAPEHSDATSRSEAQKKRISR